MPDDPMVQVRGDVICIKTCDIIFTVCILLLTSMILATPKQSLAKRINVKEVCSLLYYISAINQVQENFNLFKSVFSSNVQYLMLLTKLPIKQGQPRFSHLSCNVNYRSFFVSWTKYKKGQIYAPCQNGAFLDS